MSAREVVSEDYPISQSRRGATRSPAPLWRVVEIRSCGPACNGPVVVVFHAALGVPEAGVEKIP